MEQERSKFLALGPNTHIQAMKAMALHLLLPTDIWLLQAAAGSTHLLQYSFIVTPSLK